MASDQLEAPKKRGNPNLAPAFAKGDPRAAEAGRKGAAVRKAKRAAQAQTVAQLSTHLTELATSFQREQLGPLAAAAAAHTIARVTSGQIPIRNGDEAAALVRAFTDIARLEAGQATSHSVTASLGGEGALARVVELQQQAREAIARAESSAATAAADQTGGGAEAITPGAAIEAESTAPPPAGS